MTGAAPLEGADRDRLLAVLTSSRDLGFLGPGPVETHLDHSTAFVTAWELHRPDGAPRRLLDLGSGGGVPGLVLALLWPQTAVTLLDGMVRRTTFLDDAVEKLDLHDRVKVVTARAEEAGHTDRRGTFDLITARGFAAAAVTAECAAPLAADGGLIVVAEPPTPTPGRWPADPLASLGLIALGRIADPYHMQILERTGPVPDRYPRRVGIPSKRPLWGEERS